MKVSGFTLLRNGVEFDYPFEESTRSLLPLVDELIINVGSGTDETLQRVRALQRESGGKIIVFESDWKLDDPELRKGGQILSEQTNLALERCSGEWCVYLQADEVLHEQDYAILRQSLELAHKDQRIEALVFDYIHFYGSYGVHQRTRSAYRREVRAFKRASLARSIGDAQSFRKPDGSKLRAVRCGARVFHYGWVRTPEAMRSKTEFMDSLYHGSVGLHTGDNYRYKKVWGLHQYTGTHPRVMLERIARKGWSWDLKNSKLAWRPSDVKKIALDVFERVTGIRLFEYRCYQLISSREFPPRPLASILLATYEMPVHLEKVLSALERQSYAEFEIILCDDGSGDRTRAVVESARSRIQQRIEHLWQKNEGFRKCRILNAGIRASRGSLLIFLDGDCVPHRDFVLDHVRSWRDGFYSAGRRVEVEERFSREITPEAIRLGILDRTGLKVICAKLSGQIDHLQRTWRIPYPWLRRILGMHRILDLKGCNFSVDRSSMERINGFDESYEGYGREDTDVEIRLQHAGLKIRSLKGLALQYHLWHERRAFTPANDDRLEQLRASGRVRAERGLT